MELISSTVEGINNYPWGVPMVGLLFRAHLFLIFQIGLIQRRTFTGVRLSVARDPDSHGDVSQFTALITALVSTIDTEDIIDMGIAIALGGPGVVLWCRLTGVLGTVTKHGESLIAVEYRVHTKDGTTLGSIMYALERDLGMRWLGITSAVLGTLTSFGVGYGVQVNAISNIVDSNVAPVIMADSEGLKSPLTTCPWSISLAVGLVTGGTIRLIIFRGVKSITEVYEKLASSVASLYVMGCLVTLFINRVLLGQTLSVIFKSAFIEVRSITGNLAGTGIMMSARYGITGGPFSNESGISSVPIVTAAARICNPVRQAFVSTTGTFWDTVVVCLMTGLVLISSVIDHGTMNVTNPSGGEPTSAAFSSIPYIGQPMLIVGTITFTCSTILGRSYYGERCLEHLMGRRGIIPYHVAWIAVLVAVPIMQLELIWPIADTLNALMTIPNLIAVLLLSGMITKETKYYLASPDERGNTPIPPTEDQGAPPLLKR